MADYANTNPPLHYDVFIHQQKNTNLLASGRLQFAAPQQARRSAMSTQQLAEILKISAQNPAPANATPPMMRAWAEGITRHTPLADGVKITRTSLGPHQGDLIQPGG